MMEFLVVQGDITDQVADALVNSINSSCQLEHGVARAFREAAGDGIQEALFKIAPEAPEGGSVLVTDGFDLPTKYVLHAVAVPLDTGATEGSIRKATRRALIKADERGCRSIALPALGAGLSNYDYSECARIICEELTAYAPTTLEEALLVGYTAEEHEILRSTAWDFRTRQ